METVAKHMVANILPIDPLPGPWGGVKRSKFIFSEHGHGAYQIKGNGECSIMQAHFLFIHTPSTPVVKSKVKTIFLLKVGMLHIKLTGMEHSAPCKHICCPNTHRGIRRSFYSESNVSCCISN